MSSRRVLANGGEPPASVLRVANERRNMSVGKSVRKSARRIRARLGAGEFQPASPRPTRDVIADTEQILDPPMRFDPVPDLRKLPNAKYVYVVGAIPRNFGGRTASILHKCRLLKQIGGVDSTIVTLNYSAEIDDISEDLRQRGLLIDGIEIVNIHDFFDGDSAYNGPEIVHEIDEPGMDKIRDPDQEVYRYFENGVYRLYKRFDFSGRLIVRDFFNENRGRTRRDEFNPNGTIRRTTYMDLHYNKPRQEIFYRGDGTPYLNKWLVVNKQTLTTRVERITVMDAHGHPTHVLFSNVELIQSYFDRLIGNERAFLIVESRRSDHETLGYLRPNVKQVYVLHNPHIAPPFEDVSLIRPAYKQLMDNRTLVDGVVFLTNAQRADAELHFGRQQNFQVIPHPADPGAPAPFANRDPDLVVMLARLDQQKQIAHAIDVFVQVLAQRPTARLDIYGHGPQEAMLQTKIDKLGIGESVRLAGYTKDPAAVYRQASLSLLTSKYEGFGLVLLESLSNGCPVVSYDAKYGPGDIVVDGVNGFLVPNGDQAAMAKRVCDILSDGYLRAKLSGNAALEMSNFSEENFVSRWSGLFHGLFDEPWQHGTESVAGVAEAAETDPAEEEES